MSLINDALRRARRKTTDTTPPTDPTDPPLQPVETEPPNRRSSLVILAGSAVILVLAAWFLWQWWSADKPTQVALSGSLTNQPKAEAKSAVASNLAKPFQAVAKLDAALQEARQTNAGLSVSAPTSQTASVLAVAPPAEKTTTGTPASLTNTPPATGTNTVAAVAVAEPPANDSPTPPTARNVAFPALKVQGIYFRLHKPSALINNRTLFLGDEVDGVRVVGIERHVVKVELKGVTKELFLK